MGDAGGRPVRHLNRIDTEKTLCAAIAWDESNPADFRSSGIQHGRAATTPEFFKSVEPPFNCDVWNEG
jgi:hypothetical protein